MRLTKNQKNDYISRKAIARKDLCICTIFIYDFIYETNDYAVYRVNSHLPKELTKYSQEVACTKVRYNAEGTPYIIVQGRRQYLNEFLSTEVG